MVRGSSRIPLSERQLVQAVDVDLLPEAPSQGTSPRVAALAPCHICDLT